MQNFIESFWFIGNGMLLTLALTMGSLFFGFGLGLLLAVLRYKKIGVKIINIYISFMRGTPLILQLGLIYFAIPGFLGMKLHVMSAGLVTFGLNSGAYIAEILRSGIESIPIGQFEAARTLRIAQIPMWTGIILPQVFRATLPSFINEITILLKETALISTIGGMDIMRRAQSIASEQFTYFIPLCIAAVCYYMLVSCVEYFGRKLGNYYALN